jgi:hypothetical protein
MVTKPKLEITELVPISTLWTDEVMYMPQSLVYNDNDNDNDNDKDNA